MVRQQAGSGRARQDGEVAGRTLGRHRRPVLGGPGADRSSPCRCRSSILSEVSTRARSKLPSGKNILVFGERGGAARGRPGGRGGASPTGPSVPLLPCCLSAAREGSLGAGMAAGESPSPPRLTVGCWPFGSPEGLCGVVRTFPLVTWLLSRLDFLRP